MQKRAVILFTRIPIPGYTKTRLQPFLNEHECCELHKAFISDMYDILRNVDADIIISYEPNGDLDELKRLVGEEATFMSQRGERLGDRMHMSIVDALNDYECCLLIGSDIPLISPEDMEAAFTILEERDVVLAPTEDGGYYLIGMKQPCEQIFQIQYSTPTVMQNTLQAIDDAGKTCGIGNLLFDIDEKDDLLKLVELLRVDGSYQCRQTRKTLSRIGKL